MDRNAAEHINSVLLRHASELKDVIALAKKSCAENEFEDFLELTSRSMAMIFDVLDRVYEQYPDLKPKELD